MLDKTQYTSIEARISIIEDARRRIRAMPQPVIPVNTGLVLAVDFAGNDPRAISCLKDSTFASKELLDNFLFKLNKVNGEIPKKYEKFIPALLAGGLEKNESTKEDVLFLRNSFQMIHSIREIRNRLKLSYSGIKVYVVNGKYFAKIDLPLTGTSLKVKNFGELMKIKNYQEAVKNKKYGVDIDIEQFMEDQLDLWKLVMENSRHFHSKQK